MLHWLHSLLPDLPHYGFALVFIVVFLNNLGVPMTGKTILLAAGFILGKNGGSLWQPMAAGTAGCFLGGICTFWLGRRLDQVSLKKIHWLHLTPARLKWPQRFFKRYGAKAVFIARVTPLLPAFAASLLAGMAKMPWRIFLFYDLTGSIVCGIGYILIGYIFGTKWKLLEAWLGPTALYLILAGIALIALGVIFRDPVSVFWVRHVYKKRKRK